MYDRVPKKRDEGPAYKHVQVVRKHDERKKLGTMACKECENVRLWFNPYYSAPSIF